MPVIDMTGKKFNHWTVIERVSNNKNGDAMWLCECDCEEHTRQIVKGSSLRSGHSKSCGCLKKRTAAELGRKNAKDLTGRIFGKLTVLGKAYSKNYKMHWKCQCSCPDKTITYVPTDKLISGHTRSCGCLTWNNLLGQTFGKLTVIEKTEQSTNDGCIVWKCQCSCENKTIIEVPSTKLTSGQTFHCGCEKGMSVGENAIASILTENHIPFQREKIFKELHYENGTHPRFDFYVNDKYIIEFDGEQHFNPRENGWFSKEYVLAIRAKDVYKNNWCKENNISIIRIPYTKLNTLAFADLVPETSEFLLR